MADEQDKQVIQAVKELQAQMNEGFAKMNERFEQVDKRLDGMDERISKLEDSMTLLVEKHFDNERDIYRLKKAIGR